MAQDIAEQDLQDARPQQISSLLRPAIQPQTQTEIAPAPMSQEAYDSFVSRTGVPLPPETSKSLLPLLQKRKEEMIREELNNSMTPTNKSVSKLDIFLHGQEDAMRHAHMKQQAEEEGRMARWKSFNNAVSQYSGIDPKTALAFQKEERSAAEAARKNDITEKYKDAAQKTKDVLANGKIDFWNRQGAHLDRNDTETALHHRTLEEQSKWARESINSLEKDKLQLDRYKAEIYAGKASQDMAQRAARLQQDMDLKRQAFNTGITKFNVARQFELSKVNPKTGKPLYQDENGNIPAYTPIPTIELQPEQPEIEASPLSPFPEAPQISATPAPPAMQATAQSLPPIAQGQKIPIQTPMGTVGPPPQVPQLSGAGAPPPWNSNLDRAAMAKPPQQSGATRKVSSLKSSEAMAKPQNRDKAKDKYHSLIGQGMDSNAAFSQAKKEFPY